MQFIIIISSNRPIWLQKMPRTTKKMLFRSILMFLCAFYDVNSKKTKEIKFFMFSMSEDSPGTSSKMIQMIKTSKISTERCIWRNSQQHDFQCCSHRFVRCPLMWSILLVSPLKRPSHYGTSWNRSPHEQSSRYLSSVLYIGRDHGWSPIIRILILWKPQ